MDEIDAAVLPAMVFLPAAHRSRAGLKTGTKMKRPHAGKETIALSISSPTRCREPLEL
jgi:hypothetical protein